MYSIYCKEIHFYYKQKYIIKYFGITSNFENRKFLYETNNREKTTFIQCSIKDILKMLKISFKEFPIYLVDNILNKENAEIKELDIVLKERLKNELNTIILGSFFTFPKYKIIKQNNKIDFLKTFYNEISHKLQNFNFEKLKELYFFCKFFKKDEIIDFLEIEGFTRKEIDEIIVGYGGFCYKCKEKRHLQRQCEFFK